MKSVSLLVKMCNGVSLCFEIFHFNYFSLQLSRKLNLYSSNLNIIQFFFTEVYTGSLKDTGIHKIETISETIEKRELIEFLSLVILSIK